MHAKVNSSKKKLENQRERKILWNYLISFHFENVEAHEKKDYRVVQGHWASQLETRVKLWDFLLSSVLSSQFASCLEVNKMCIQETL